MRNNLHNKTSFLLFLLLLSALSGFSQVTQQWVKRYNGPGNASDYANSIAVDGSGNVYVAGTYQPVKNEPSDLILIKYDAAGNQLWTRSYNGPNNLGDAARAIAVDATGNVYVTGWSEEYEESGDYLTIKYNSNGDELWVKRYNGPGKSYDAPYALAVDKAGNVYVSGASEITFQTDLHYTTIKYDTDGNQQWVRIFGPANTTYNEACFLKVDASGNVYVAGSITTEIAGKGTYFDFVTIKYDTYGNQLWSKVYTGPGDLSKDEASSIGVDHNGNVYVTGWSGTDTSDYDYTTIKYNANGKQLWISKYNGSSDSFRDRARSLAVDDSGNVYVTGQSGTVKYNTNGNQLWVAKYDDMGASSIVVDGLGHAYVTGTTFTNETATDFATVTYKANGDLLWVKTYNGPGNHYDYASALAVDSLGNVYVTGYSEGIETGPDIATIKYVQEQPTLPLKVAAGKDTTVYLGYGSHCATLHAKAKGGTPPYTFSWSPGVAMGKSIKVCPDKTTTYTVTVTDAKGNTASDKVKVTVIDIRCGKKDNKVLVCHKGKKTLCIATPAVAAHLRHGDHLGSCSMDASVTEITDKAALQMVSETPEHFKVSSAPNPFNTSTRIYYELPFDGKVTITVYDQLGRLVTTLVQAEQRAGSYNTQFNAPTLSKGLYYYHVTLTTNNKVYQRAGKMLVVK